MEPVYKQHFTLSNMHVDRYGRAKPSTLLYFVQEAAGQHCRLLSVDHAKLAPKHLFWAVSRNRVQITRLPRLGETVYVETWPMPTTKVAYPRSVIAYDEAGNELFRSISLWVLMDDRTRAMILPDKSGVSVDGTITGKELAVPRAVATRPMDASVTRTVGFSLLDCNGHMNNTFYMDWIADLLPSEFHQDHPVQEFTVCYINEAREGDEIDLSFALDHGPVLTVNAQQNGTRMFSAQVLF